MESSRIRVGVIGLGYISQYFIAAIKKNLRCQLVAVCDLEEKATELYGREGLATYSDYRQLLLDHDVHSVTICLQNSLHYKVSRDALLKVIDELKSKPIAHVEGNYLETIEEYLISGSNVDIKRAPNISIYMTAMVVLISH
jgi:hypothetical protein